MEANVWPFWLFGLSSVVDNSFSSGDVGDVGDDVYVGLRETQLLQYNTLSHIFIYIDRGCP